jgi:TonB family protein
MQLLKRLLTTTTAAAVGFCLVSASTNAANKKAPAKDETKETQEAIATDSQLIKAYPKDGALYSDRGDSYFDLGQFKKAFDDADMAAKLDPTDPIAFTVRGKANFKLGQYAAAIKDLSQAINLDGREGTPYHFRSLTYEKMGNQKMAAKDATSAKLLEYGKKVTYDVFLQSTQFHIIDKWSPTRWDPQHIPYVQFSIHRDGTISNIIITKSSGIPELDKEAVETVGYASPLAVLPQGSPPRLNLDFGFTAPGRPKNAPNARLKLVTVTRNQDLTPYLNIMVDKFVRINMPVKDQESKSAVVRFDIRPDGTVTNPKITTPSGVGVVDKAVLWLLNSEYIKPLPMLPKTQKTNIEMEWTYGPFSADKNPGNGMMLIPHAKGGGFDVKSRHL